MAKAEVIHRWDDVSPPMVITRVAGGRDTLGIEIASTIVPLFRAVNQEATETFVSVIGNMRDAAYSRGQVRAFVDDAPERVATD